MTMDKLDTVVHMLARAADQAPDQEALVCEGDRLTYAEYARCVAGFAAELRGHGASGQRVVVLMANSIDCCIAIFAAHACHAQAVPLNPLYTERELRAILADASPQVIICDQKVAPLASRLADNVHLITVGPGGKSLTRWRSDSSLSLSVDFPARDCLANLQYTGGTTGRSKGVNLTHGAIAVNISQCDELLPMNWQSERLLAIMPLYHVYAQAMCLHKMAYCAGTLVIVARFDTKTVLDALVEERITIFAGGPTLFRAMLSYDEFCRTDFPCLRFTVSGSSALPAELMQRFVSVTKKPVIEGYGQTETGPVISFNPLQGPHKLASVGIPVPGTLVQIVDLDRGVTPLAPGEKGEIRVRGPQVMSGYRNLPAETAETLRDGWLYTSDIGTFDQDGYLYICDRKKEMVIVSGFNVFPREVEEVLYMHDAVDEAAVIGVDHDYRGQTVKAFVVLRHGVMKTAEELTEHCRTNLAAYKVPTIFEFLTELPKTAVNKIDKKQLRNALWKSDNFP
jgi:long-chain acyl-CoA synthetase